MDLAGIESLASAKAMAFTQDQDIPVPGGDHQAAGEKFEALMATMLVKQMRKSLPNGFFGTGPGADTFGGWLDKSIGDALADDWQVGIAGMVKTGLDNKQAQLEVKTTKGGGA